MRYIRRAVPAVSLALVLLGSCTPSATPAVAPNAPGAVELFPRPADTAELQRYAQAIVDEFGVQAAAAP